VRQIFMSPEIKSEEKEIWDEKSLRTYRALQSEYRYQDSQLAAEIAKAIKKDGPEILAAAKARQLEHDAEKKIFIALK